MAKKASKKRTKAACKCYEGADKALRPHGAKMPFDMLFDLKGGKVSRSARMRIVVEKADDPEERKRRRRLPMLTANFCPMCGVKYPEDMP